MRIRTLIRPLLAGLLLLPASTALGQHRGPRASDPPPLPAVQQDTGTVSGTVTLDVTGDPLHAVRVLFIELNRSAVTSEDGTYRLDGVPAGTYQVIAVRESLSSERATISVAPGADVVRDFVMSLSSIHEHVTVTASGRETTEFDAFNSVSVLDSTDIARDMGGTLADVLENEPGLAKRSFGPGSSRPIIRGFDNDRVLIMQDGVRTGDLSSQSGDHGVSLDPASVERIEVVKGPATLLYGSNAIGGVVNTLTPQQQFGAEPPQELRGQLTVDGGTANEQLGGNGNFQWGSGDFMLWFGGGARRAGDYDTPQGTVPNSGSRLANGRAGLGLFGDRGSVSLGYTVEDARYGVPFASEFHGHGEEEEEEEEGHDGEEEVEIDLASRRQALRLEGALRHLETPLVESLRAVVSYLDWHHEELEVAGTEESVGTEFDNRTWIGRLELHQRRMGRLGGQFGLWAQSREYVATGEEALAPPTDQSSLAAFAYEEVDFETFRLMLGTRIERNSYDPGARPEAGDAEEAPDVRERSFTGFSGALGLHVPVGDELALVANATTAYRAPALEELYNFGPHVGNLAFEIGNPELQAERSNGGEVSVRFNAPRLRGEANLFYYSIDRFIFGALSGELVDGLQEVQFLQGDSRFLGFDGTAELRLDETLRLRLGAGYVSAKLTDTDEALPRIPPLHARVGLDWSPMHELSVRPTLRFAAGQDDVFRSETPTDGYVLVDLAASYTVATSKALHIFAAQIYNVADELYRNHTSFIKELAPEMGRGVKVTYALRVF